MKPPTQPPFWQSLADEIVFHIGLNYFNTSDSWLAFVDEFRKRVFGMPFFNCSIFNPSGRDNGFLGLHTNTRNARKRIKISEISPTKAQLSVTRLVYLFEIN